MTLDEAKMTIYANCIYACEKAGFDLSTICMVDDALRTVIAIADRKTENSSEKPNNCDTCRFELYCPEMCEGCCEWDSHYEPKDEPQKHCHRSSDVACHPEQGDMWCRGCDYWYTNEPQMERENE